LTVGGPAADDRNMTTLERAEAAEHALSQELDRVVVKSVIYTSGERDPRVPMPRPPDSGKRYMMGQDPRLAPMPARPTLIDYFTCRFASGTTNHLLQSARLAQKSGASEKIILACLLHDIAIGGFIRGDHGYWAAQMLEPYVDEEVTWAIRYHQALRFYADESVGYKYPELYAKLFGADYQPDEYIERDYKMAREHKWYMTARLICVNDLYAFDPTVRVELEEFTDVIGRNFKQPKEGLGWDASPSAHMWRTIMCPTKYL
jgi:HD domain